MQLTHFGLSPTIKRQDQTGWTELSQTEPQNDQVSQLPTFLINQSTVKNHQLVQNHSKIVHPIQQTHPIQ